MNKTEKIKLLKANGFKEQSKDLYSKEIDVGLFFWDFLKKDESCYVSKSEGGFLDKKLVYELDEAKLFSLAFKKASDVKSSNQLMLSSKTDAYDLINVRDDEQVIQELQGGFLKEFVYSFPTSEGKVTGLSWAGVKEVARQMGNISIDDVVINETDSSYQVKAKARDVKRNVTMFGVTEQSKYMVLKNGEKKLDLHALSKCVSRAQRNAIRTLIPEELIKTMINQYVKNR